MHDIFNENDARQKDPVLKKKKQKKSVLFTSGYLARWTPRAILGFAIHKHSD